MNNEHLNVVFSSDDRYAQHMGIAIYSLLEHNKTFDAIRIFVIDNDISEDNIRRLHTVVSSFHNADLTLIPFESIKQQLHLKLEWHISLSAYARLFVSTFLPDEVDRVLYLDCDMIVCSDLHELWGTDIGDCLVGAIQDSVNAETKAAVGVAAQDKYFNSGMLLIPMSLWRQCGFEQSCREFIVTHNGAVRHHDQGVLNGVCRGRVHYLPLQYNLMTIHYIFDRRQIMQFYREEAPFYTNEEIQTALQSPAIMHYTPSFTSRPWVKGCKHPQKHLYWETLAKTPWAGEKPQRNTEKWYVRLINWRYRIFKV